jgi:hypothetical protein
MIGQATPGDADVIITGQSGGTQLGQSCGGPGGNTAGWKFTVGPTDLQATALGEYDADGDGLGMNVEVGVWDSSGTLLGMVTVPSGTMPPLIGSFRYQALASSFVLQSLQTYTIGSRCTGMNVMGGYAPLDGPSFTFSSDFSAAGGRYNNGGLSTTFSQPTMNLGGSIFLGPNLEFSLLDTATPTSTATQTPTGTGTGTATSTATATATATNTPTATDTPTPLPNGSACQNGSQCQSGFCVDGVCCDNRLHRPESVVQPAAQRRHLRADPGRTGPDDVAARVGARAGAAGRRRRVGADRRPTLRRRAAGLGGSSGGLKPAATGCSAGRGPPTSSDSGRSSRCTG